MKELIVHPSGFSDPNRLKEHVVLENPDGSPFSGGSGGSGGAIELFSFKYADPAGDYASISGDPITTNSIRIPKFSVADLSSAIDPAHIKQNNLHPDLESDPDNTAGVKKDDWLSTWGPGVLGLGIQANFASDGAYTGGFFRYLDVASLSWGDLGYEYPLVDPIVDSRLSDTDHTIEEYRSTIIHSDWEDDSVGFLIALGRHDQNGPGIKLRYLRVFAYFIPFG